MKRLGELDSVRGLAALGIIGLHIWGLNSYLRFSVDVFFVLSGYLITGIVLKNARSHSFLMKFYVRRGLRIWPIYYLTFLALCLVYPLLETCRLDGLPYYLTYTQFCTLYFGQSTPPMDLPMYHTWTLAVEAQFYLLWPLLLVLFGPRSVVAMVALGLGMSITARGLMGLSVWTLLARLDGLLLGALLAVIFLDRSRVEARRRTWNWVFGLAFLASPFALAALTMAAASWPDRGGALRLAFGYSCINLCFFGLVGLLILHNGHRALAPLRLPWLCYLGTISYGLYLYHVPIWHSLEHVAKLCGVESRLVQRVAATFLTFLVATLSWEFLEKPINSLKDRFSFRTAPEASGAKPLEVRGPAVTSS